MIFDADHNPRYYDKQWDNRPRVISPELKALYIEMAINPKFHISREYSFYPKSFPSFSIGFGVG
jgi:hypothetical protein